MAISKRHRGFSLTEVLLAVGTLAVGLTFVGGTFLTGIYLSSVSTERTTGTAVAKEAFAKIRLYGVDVTDPNLAADRQTSFETLQHSLAGLTMVDPNEFAYPSTRTVFSDKQYFWSALCRLTSTDPDVRLVQVTVFVSRKMPGADNFVGGALWPVPVEVPVAPVTGAGNENKLQITDADQQTYIGAGDQIVDNQTGRIYRVLDEDPADLDVVILDVPWQGGTSDTSVWVVPPALSGGRRPGIGVYQRFIRF